MATEILYCSAGGYKPRAASLAASLDSRFGEKAEIKAGKSGQFDVIVNGRLVFSKSSAGRFPVDDEVEEIFAALKEGREVPRMPEKKKPEGFVARVLGKMTNGR